MNITDVKELLQAGFTASEIREMLADKKEEAPAEPAAAPEVKKEEAAAAAAPEVPAEPEKKKDSAKEISDAVSAAIAESFKPFEEIYNKLATLAGMPSIADVQPKGIDDIITNFFKED